jgi:hypothetical protein
MKRFFEYFLPVCFHEFETIEKIEITKVDPLIEYGLGDLIDIMKKSNPRCREKYETPIGFLYILGCKKCGKIKQHRENLRYNK